MEQFMDEARQAAAQCWCDEETKHIPMDPVLAEAVARRIAAWMDTCAFHARNEEYWKNRAEAAEITLAAAKPVAVVADVYESRYTIEWLDGGHQIEGTKLYVHPITTTPLIG